MQNDGWTYIDKPTQPKASVDNGGWEYIDELTPGPAKAVSRRPVKSTLPDIDGVAAVQAVFPGTRINQNRRDPNSTLGMANPGSFHNFGRNAVDIPAIPGVTFEEAKKRFEAKGYKIHPDSRDEYANPSAHATGGHWHFVFEGAPEPTANEWQYIDEPVKEPEAPQDDFMGVAGDASVQSLYGPKIGRLEERNNRPGGLHDEVIQIGETPVDLPKHRMALTNQEVAGNDYVEKTLATAKKDGKKWDDIETDFRGRFGAGWWDRNKKSIRHYYDNEYGDVNWVGDPAKAPSDTEATPEEEIVVEGDKSRIEDATSLENTFDFAKDNLELGFRTGPLGWASRKVSGALFDGEDPRAEIDRRAELEARLKNNPYSEVSGAGLDEFLLQAVGGIGPEAIPPLRGGSAAGRLAGAMLSGGAGDALIQMAEIDEGIQNQFDFERNLLNVGAGGALQGVVGEPLLAAAKKKYGEDLVYKALGGDALSPGSGKSSIVYIDEPDVPVAGKAAPKVRQRGIDARVRATRIADQYAELTKSWTNAPSRVIFSTFKALEKADAKLAESLRRDGATKAPGWYGKDGQVYIIAENVKDETQLSSLVFHEGLGHFGLEQTYGADLAQTMIDLRTTNKKIADESAVLALGRYGDAYGDTVGLAKAIKAAREEPGAIRRKRAMAAVFDAYPEFAAKITEEVLAKRSEAGVISKNILDKLYATIKPYAEKLGLNFRSDGMEIRAILADSHARVVSGARAPTLKKGAKMNNKYILTTHVSPHDFTNIDAENPYGKFDSSKMGTGEGAQMFSWGHYTGENTREAYFRKFSRDLGSGAKVGDVDVTDIIRNEFDKDFSVDWERVNNAIKNVEEDISWYYDNQSDYPGSYAFIENQLDNYEFALQDMTARVEEAKAVGKDVPYLQSALKDIEYTVDAYRTLKEAGPFEFTGKRPKTYEVDAPDHITSRMLLWDETLDKQPKNVQDIAKEYGFKVLSEDDILTLRDRLAEAEDAWTNHFEEYIRPVDIRMKEYSQAAFDEVMNKSPEAVFSDPEIFDLMESGLTWKAALEEQAWNAYYAAGKEWRTRNPFDPAIRKAHIQLGKEVDRLQKDIRGGQVTGENLYEEFVRLKGSPKEASLYLASKGIPGNKYKDGFSRGRDGKPSYNYVWWNDEGPDAPKVINKYMLEEEDSHRAGSINLDKIITRGGLDTKELYRAFAEGIDKGTYTQEDAVNAVKAQGLTPSRALKKLIEVDPTAGISASIALEKGHQDLIKLQKKLLKGDFRSLDQQLRAEDKFRYLLTRQAEMQAKVAGYRTSIGRALNFMKIATDAENPVLTRIMKDNGLDNILDRDVLYKIARTLEEHDGDPMAKSKVIKDTFEELPEDYFLSFQYSMMLYSFSTQGVNFVGNAGTTLLDSASSLTASLIGLPKKFSGGDRIPVRAAVFRNLALMKALFQGQTWADVGTSFMEGRPAHQVSKVEVGHNMFTELGDRLGGKVGRGLGSALDLPQKGLAASDSLWRSMLENAHLYEQAMIVADKEGLTGARFSDRVDEIIHSPPEDIQKLVDDYVATIQLVDDPDFLTRMFVELAKARPKDPKTAEGIARRILLRIPAHIIFPFSRVASNILRTGIRHTPLIGLFDRTNLADFRAGGARRDKAFGRQIVGATIYAYLMQKAENDELTGEGPKNFDRRRQMEAEGWQPNSIKLSDGKWHSLNGLDAIAPIAGVIAGLTADFKEGTINEEDFIGLSIETAVRIGNHLSQNTFAEQAGQFLKMVGDGPEAQMAKNSFIPGLVSRNVPAFVRQYAEDSDGYMRDTSGTGDITSRIEGRLKSAIPGMREELPIRHDVYGKPIESNRPFFGINREKAPTSDPVLLEVRRLTELAGPKKALIDPIDRGNLPEGPIKDGKRSEDVQKLQALSGQYLYDDLSSVIGTEEWKSMTDEEKIKEIQRMKKIAREDAIADLWPETLEEE